MKNLKPSELPEGTFIDDEAHGEFIKRPNGVWEEFETDMLGDKDRISDVLYDYKDEEFQKLRLFWRVKSDDYFKNYTVVAVPPGFDFRGKALLIHGPWVDAIGGFADGTRPHECKGYNCEA